ncbi:MAG: hypothetical protein ACNA8W_13020 [Bradymonadaceae bacterium]
MTNLFRKIDLHVDCGQCDHSYDIPLSVVAESQALLEQACPGSLHECAASYFATLVDPACLQALAKAWEDVEESANRRADGAVLKGRLSVELFLALEDEDGNG